MIKNILMICLIPLILILGIVADQSANSQVVYLNNYYKEIYPYELTIENRVTGKQYKCLMRNFNNLKNLDNIFDEEIKNIID